MCGVCGQFNFAHGENVMIEDVAKMTSEIVHRGPDDCGYYTDGSSGFGFRRLSIIDLRGGHQPMSNREKSVWVVFNGEIYNFREVREQLKGRGYRFRTDSDTEVIVHGYTQWGEDVLDHLNGMFGLAIWDVKRRRLMLARDRTGIKPMYYAVHKGKLLFGSEIRAILAGLGETPPIDPMAIQSFLRYRYTPAPDTILKGIKKLPAGTRLVVEQGGAPIVARWWTYSPQPFDPMPRDEDAATELLDIYQRAIKRHLISDVPVGLLLSGGMDSALLLALMCGVRGSWNTYSIGYGSSFVDDELRDAADTARMLGASNTAIEISSTDFETALDKIVDTLEEPVATSSVVPMYYVCRRAREDVTVALIGQGPDELFGGYKRHLGVRYGQYWRRVPKALRSCVEFSLRHMVRSESNQRAFHSLSIDGRLARYQQVFSLLSQRSMQVLFRNGVVTDSGDTVPRYWQDLWASMQNTDELGGLQFLEIRSSLPDELLLYADKLSMAHSLELRVPYLDQEIVEYAERLSADFKVRRGVRKWLHRRVAKQLLPNQILNRKKRGFATNVVDSWIRGSMSRSIQGVFEDRESLIYDYLDPASVAGLLRQHQLGSADHHKILFSMVVLEHVLRKYAARRPSSEPSYREVERANRLAGAARHRGGDSGF
jgi:asparagine synthase (glutamine-hydrolysing)